MPHLHELIDFTVTGYVVKDEKVLLILHKKLNLWLPPGGHIELNEDPEEALHRELKEEVGLEVEIVGTKPEHMSERTKMLYSPPFLDIHWIDSTHRHVGMNYICRTKSEMSPNLEEIADAKWFTKEQLEAADLLPEVRYYALEALKRT